MFALSSSLPDLICAPTLQPPNLAFFSRPRFYSRASARIRQSVPALPFHFLCPVPTYVLQRSLSPCPPLQQTSHHCSSPRFGPSVLSSFAFSTAPPSPASHPAYPPPPVLPLDFLPPLPFSAPGLPFPLATFALIRARLTRLVVSHSRLRPPSTAPHRARPARPSYRMTYRRLCGEKLRTGNPPGWF